MLTFICGAISTACEIVLFMKKIVRGGWICGDKDGTFGRSRKVVEVSIDVMT